MVQGNRTVKNLTRKRMDETGETYTVARAAVDALKETVDVTGKFESWEDLLPLLDNKDWVFDEHVEFVLKDPRSVENGLEEPEFLLFDASCAGDATHLSELGNADVMLSLPNDLIRPLQTDRIVVEGKTKKEILIEVSGIVNGVVKAFQGKTPMPVRLQTIEEATLRNLIWNQENYADDQDWFIEGGKELVESHLQRMLNNPQLKTYRLWEHEGSTTSPENLGVVTPYWEDVQNDMFNLMK